MRSQIEKLSDIIVRFQPGHIRILITVFGLAMLLITNSPGTPGDVGGFY